MKENYVDTNHFFADVEQQLYWHGLRLNAFCDVVNVSRQTMWRWKRGRAVLPVNVFYMFCNLLNLDASDYLVENKEARELKAEFDKNFPHLFNK